MAIVPSWKNLSLEFAKILRMLFFQSTASVFSTFLQFTWFSNVISVARIMAMTAGNFRVSKVWWFSDFY